MPRVYNKRFPRIIPQAAVYVGRPTKWGNPYTVDVYGRGVALDRYEKWIWAPEQRRLRAAMRFELRGKDLICWCTPWPCHADIILEIANG